LDDNKKNRGSWILFESPRSPAYTRKKKGREGHKVLTAFGALEEKGQSAESLYTDYARALLKRSSESMERKRKGERKTPISLKSQGGKEEKKGNSFFPQFQPPFALAT